MIKTFSNAQLYAFSNNLNSAFSNETRYLPAKVSYFILKNKNKIFEQAENIEQTRMNIIKHYGTLSADGARYDIDNEHVEEANKELAELLAITQDIDISMINLSDLLNLDFTLEQMEALAFMIEE
jgi:hypothetical protein